MVSPDLPHIDVLLVDDDESVNFLVERGVRRSGRSYAWCADDSSAQRFLSAHTVTFLLLDQRLQGCFGHELLERLAAERLLGAARVAICTSHPPDRDARERIEALGAELRLKSDILSRDGLLALLDQSRD